MNSAINFSGFTDLLAQHADELREQAKQELLAQQPDEDATTTPSPTIEEKSNTPSH